MDNVKEVFVPKLNTINEMARAAQGKIKGYLTKTDEKPDISYELLQILHLSDDLTQIFNPDKQSAEYYGLPKEVILGASTPKEIFNSVGVNFTPWFAEKAQGIKNGVKKAICSWEENASDLKLAEDAPMTVEEYILYGLESGLHEVESYSETILDMLSKE